MLSAATLKNINIKDFEGFFSDHLVRGRSTRVRAASTPEKYENISKIIKEELAKATFSSEQLEEFLFERLYYTNNDHHYVYKYDSFFANNKTTLDKAAEYLTENPGFYLNTLIHNQLDITRSYNICTTRVESNDDGLLKAIHLLVRISTEDLKYGETNIFAGVMIDIATGLVLFKFGLNEFDEIDREPLKIVDGLKRMLGGEGTDGQVARPLNFNVIGLNEQEPKEAIFYLFEELSKEAEVFLNAYVDEEYEDKIRKFLINEMNLHEAKSDYIEQIKAVVYQDISSTIDTNLFEDGWVFRFHYREGDHTRATSKQDDRGPVYSSKTFWQLKELIYKEQEMLEAGFHWYLYGNAQIEEFVDVRLIAQNDTMVVHHYFNNRHGRKEKEEFVLRKIAQHLS